MMKPDSDKDLVKALLAKNEKAWEHFWKAYKTVILGQIKLIFHHHRYNASQNKLEECFDFVIDHFLFGKVFENYKPGHSLKGYIKQTTRNRAIDWYRSQVSGQNIYGLTETEIAQDQKLDDESQDNDGSDSLGNLIENCDLTQAEYLFLKLMCMGFIDLTDADFDALSQITGKQIPDLRQLVSDLEKEAIVKRQESEGNFNKTQTLFYQLKILENMAVPDCHKIDKKKNQLGKLISEFNKKGFSYMPGRTRINQILNLPKNEVENLYARIKKKLKENIILRK